MDVRTIPYPGRRVALPLRPLAGLQQLKMTLPSTLRHVIEGYVPARFQPLALDIYGHEVLELKRRLALANEQTPWRLRAAQDGSREIHLVALLTEMMAFGHLQADLLDRHMGHLPNIDLWLGPSLRAAVAPGVSVPPEMNHPLRRFIGGRREVGDFYVWGCESGQEPRIFAEVEVKFSSSQIRYGREQMSNRAEFFRAGGGLERAGQPDEFVPALFHPSAERWIITTRQPGQAVFERHRGNERYFPLPFEPAVIEREASDLAQEIFSGLNDHIEMRLADLRPQLPKTWGEFLNVAGFEYPEMPARLAGIYNGEIAAMVDEIRRRKPATIEEKDRAEYFAYRFRDFRRIVAQAFGYVRLDFIRQMLEPHVGPLMLVARPQMAGNPPRFPSIEMPEYLLGRASRLVEASSHEEGIFDIYGEAQLELHSYPEAVDRGFARSDQLQKYYWSNGGMVIAPYIGSGRSRWTVTRSFQERRLKKFAIEGLPQPGRWVVAAGLWFPPHGLQSKTEQTLVSMGATPTLLNRWAETITREVFKPYAAFDGLNPFPRRQERSAGATLTKTEENKPE